MHPTTGNDAVHQYRKIGMTNTVNESSPHRLIQMMMEHALAKLNFASGYIERGEIEKKGRAIGDAISLINGLQASLNHKTNSRMSENFDALYAYMMRRLLTANLKDDVGILEEVAGLLRELKDAWDAIADDPKVLESEPAQN